MAVSALGGPTAPPGVEQQIDEPSIEGSRGFEEIGLGLRLGLGFF